MLNPAAQVLSPLNLTQPLDVSDLESPDHQLSGDAAGLPASSLFRGGPSSSTGQTPHLAICDSPRPPEENVKLSAEVEPFVPQKKTPDPFMVPMALPSDSGSVSGVEPTPIPSYLITCYPFVQENQSNRQFPVYSNDIRWQQPSPSPAGPYLAYPILSAQPPVSAEYTYYQLMPAPCAQVMGFYHPFPAPYSGTFQAASSVSAVAAECPERPGQLGQVFPVSTHRSRNSGRGPLVPKQQLLQQHIKSKRPLVKNVATQKETNAAGPDNRSKIVLLVDASQQTDIRFLFFIANKSLSESTTTMLWKSKGRRRRASHPTAESSSEQGASEADIDSDSGYCSPKHNKQPAAGALRNPEPGTTSDEDGFQELNEHSNAQDENIQQKLSSKVLDDLPENSPINIVQTPIPITTSVPKRAKSQKKKALAAALATAQEYSEISMEQKKLQEALSKAAGKKTKTPVQLDLGDMLAALEKQQQAMKARQITNTRPLSCTEREEKKGRLAVDHSLLGAEEPTEAPLDLMDDSPEEGPSQEDNGLSMPSDTSLSPASQNSPYCMTPVSQGSPASSGIGSPMASSTITKIHSKRFREYCNQVLSKEIDECVTLLLQELVSFQERVYQKDPTRAKARRRLVMGLREVTKHMKLNKIKCVIISPNCGLDEALYNVIAMAREQEIPFVFALGRKALGRCVNKLVPVSVVGIFNYFGAESLFNKLVELTEEARKAYKDMVAAMEQEQAEEALRNVKKVPHHMGHSRNPSAASAISFCSVISEPISEVNEKEYGSRQRRWQVAARVALLVAGSVAGYRRVGMFLLLEGHLGEGMQQRGSADLVSESSPCCVVKRQFYDSETVFCCVKMCLQFVETNWRNMVETSDGLETSENEKEASGPRCASEKPGCPPPAPGPTGKQPALALPALGSAASGPGPGKAQASDKEEVRPDDLEWASQQSTETGSLDGSCRDLLNSSITSTTSTLVPGMLEEEDAEDEDEDDEEDYAHEPISVEVQLNSRIESWVSETQRTMETLQLGKSLPGPEEDHAEQSGDEDAQAPEGLGLEPEPELDTEAWTPDHQATPDLQKPSSCGPESQEHEEPSAAPRHA
ncbi:SECIS-binding protein 2-like protein [Heterocephalus glaber]|uniref:SECIS-binding protein 2-like protein n=1 Tax=Heterocephalus glaber TaxID=10181 RepID=G5CA42_HETGA|nr:SECIS-binding protein 2-like protein [Heterocephalus glaber]